MGKHSISNSRNFIFNRAMAVALAAGVSFGGVQIVNSQDAQAATLNGYCGMSGDMPLDIYDGISRDKVEGEEVVRNEKADGRGGYSATVQNTRVGSVTTGNYLDEKINWLPTDSEYRDVTIKYTLDNPEFKFEKLGTENTKVRYYVGRDTANVKDPSGLCRNGYSYYTYDEVSKTLGDLGVTIDVSADGQEATVVVPHLRSKDAVTLSNLLKVTSEKYTSGATFNLSGEFVNGVGSPQKSFEWAYYRTASDLVTPPEYSEPEPKPEPKPETPAKDVFIDGKPKVDKNGTVTLHRNDGEDITFKVPTGSKVDVNKDGDLVITQPDGKKETVPLKHTTVTESGKPGTPDHKIIITDEDGKTHEFGTYDKYLEHVDDDGKGNYVFTLNDGTKVGTINLGMSFT